MIEKQINLILHGTVISENSENLWFVLFLVLLLLIRIDVCTIPLYFINRFMTRCSRTKSLFQIPFHRHINVCLLLDIGEGFKYFLIRIKINQKQGRTLGYTKFPQNIIFWFVESETFRVQLTFLIIISWWLILGV